MSSALPFLQPEMNGLNTAADDLHLEIVNLRLLVDDGAAVIAAQLNLIEKLQHEKAVIYEQARRDADARLDLCEHIVAELWRHSEEIDVRDASGNDLTLDALIDTDLPRAFKETAWALGQVLRSPMCAVPAWLRDIDYCFACARDRHRCNQCVCGEGHHDPNACDVARRVRNGAAAESAADAEAGR